MNGAIVMLENIISYVISSFKIFFIQLLILFVPFFGLAFIINILSSSIEKVCKNSIFSRVFYITQAPGTILHEVAHAFFVVIFGYQITEFVPFVLNPQKFAGRVNYAMSEEDVEAPWYHFSLFIIGVAPILFGSFAVIVLTFFCFTQEVNTSISIIPKPLDICSLSSFGEYFYTIFSNALKMFSTIFFSVKFFNPLTWIYLLLVYSIGSSITLSNEDCSAGAILGFIELLLGLACINLFLCWWGGNWINFSLYITKYNHIVYSLLLVVIFLQCLILAICTIITLITARK